jgi:uncharacterized membrane protein YfcA
MISTLEIAGWLSALVMGTTLGLLGGGGAILTVPILVYLFGHAATLATQESLLVVGLVSALGLVQYTKRGAVEFKTALFFSIPSFLGVLISRRLALPLIPEQIRLGGDVVLSKDNLLMVVFAGVMLAAAKSMIRPKPQSLASREAVSIGRIAPQGLGVGMVTGFVGAGGGFLIVPALTGLLKVPMERAVGTSLMIITLNSLFGFLMSLNPAVLGSLNWGFLGLFLALASVGMILGGRLNSRIPPARLKVGFGWFVLGMGGLILALQVRGG